MLGSVLWFRTSSKRRGAEFGVCPSAAASHARLRTLCCVITRGSRAQRLVARKEPDAMAKAEAEISELAAGIYFICKISKLAAAIVGAQRPEPPYCCVVCAFSAAGCWECLYRRAVAYGL